MAARSTLAMMHEIDQIDQALEKDGVPKQQAAGDLTPRVMTTKEVHANIRFYCADAHACFKIGNADGVQKNFLIIQLLQKLIPHQS